MNLTRKCLNLDKVKNLYNHLTDIDFNNTDVDKEISILNGANNPMLNVHMDICIGNKTEHVSLKTKFGWVIFGEHQNNNKYPKINTFSKEFYLGNMEFCLIGPYVVSEN